MADALSSTLATFALDSFNNGVPSSVTEDAKRRVLDVLGNALGGRGQQPGISTETVVTYWGGNTESSVIGNPDLRLPAGSAALVNGTLAHTLDFDDTHLPSVLHPSASIVPAVLATAQAVQASGQATLAAVAIGNELCVRLGSASYDPQLKNSIFFENGLHATSICGTLGSAVASAALMGLGKDELAHALAIAASMGAGLLEANRTGGSVKPVHCGWAAHAGITAAQLAKTGLTGPPTVLEGRFGFYRAFSEGRFDQDALIGGLGDRWEALRIFFKPYPTNHFTHAGIDAALALRRERILPGDIVELELGVPGPVLRTVAEPPDLKARPETPHAAKFSGPFTVATAFCGGGGLGVAELDFTSDTIRDPERLRLAQLVRCFQDEEATDTFPHQFPAVLRARLSDGTVKEHRVRFNRGGPQNPLTTEELIAKFELNAAHQLAPEDARRLAEAVLGLDSAKSLDSLLDLTSSPGSSARQTA